MKAIFLKLSHTEMKAQKNRCEDWMCTFIGKYEFFPLILFFFVSLFAIAFQILPVVHGLDQNVVNSNTSSFLKAATNDNHKNPAYAHGLAEGQEVEEEVRKDKERTDDFSNFGSSIDYIFFLKNHSDPYYNYAGYIPHAKKDFQILYCSFLI